MSAEPDPTPAPLPCQAPAPPPSPQDEGGAAPISLREACLAALWYTVLTGVFFAPFLFGGRTFLPADFLMCTPPWYDPSVAVHNFDLFDAIIYYHPVNVLLHEGLQQGVFPAWNPYNFGGHPLAANGQSGLFYLPRLVLQALCSPTTAHDWLLVLHTFGAGFCMFAFARRLGQSTAGALLSGTVWMFNGFSTTWLEMEFGIVVAANLAATLWALDVARERLWGAAAAAVALSFLLVCGHLQAVLYALAIIVTISAWRLLRAPRARGGVARVLAAVVLGSLLATPMLLPTLQLVSESQRPVIALSYEMAVHRQFLAWFAPTLVAPDALGSPVNNFALVRIREGGYFIYPELCAYCGLVPLLLALVGAGGRGTPRFVALAALVAVILPATPLYAPVWLLPGLSRIIATRVVFIWVFAVAVLSGFGLDRLHPRHLPRLAWAALLVLVGWGGAVAALHLQTAPVLARAWLAAGAVRLPHREFYHDAETYRAAVETVIRQQYAWDNPSVWMPLAWGTLALIWALGFAHLGREGQWTRWRHTAGAILMVLTCVDLMAFGMRFNTTAAASDVFPPNPTTEFLQQRTGHARAMGLGTFKPDTLLPAFVQDVGGYDSFYPRAASEYLTFMEKGFLREGEMLTNQVFPLSRWDTPLVDLLGVRFFVTYPDRELAGLPLVAQTPLRIYENPRALPRFFEATRFCVMTHGPEILALLADRRFPCREVVILEEDPGLGAPRAQPPADPSPSGTGAPARQDAALPRPGTTPSPLVHASGQAGSTPSPDRPHEVTEKPRPSGWPGYHPTRVELISRGEHPRILVLTDTFAPGWVARVDGREVPILRADYMFRAVAVPAGTHDVVFSYEPAALRVGLAVAAGTLCIIVGMLAASLRRRLREDP